MFQINHKMNAILKKIKLISIKIEIAILPFKKVINSIQKYCKTKRLKKIIKKYGFVCSCPTCKDFLNDQAHTIESTGLETTIYICNKCQTESEWIIEKGENPKLIINGRKILNHEIPFYGACGNFKDR